MMNRVLFDFGDIEVTVFHRTQEVIQQKIVDGAIQQVIDRGFGFPAEPSMTTVEPCPEWDEDEPTVFAVQSYVVKFDLGPVDVNINVYHENQTELTREEILEEALGYAEDAEIKVTERDVFEIETVELTEA